MQRKIKTERLVWIDITITLMALELMACFYYGVRALVLAGVCIVVSLVTELISLRLMGRKFTADDLTCTSDALIIALMLPAVMDYKIAGIACIFTVIAAKNIFGGRRNMIFSPAAAAYVFMLTSWSKELLSYPSIYTKTGVLETADELVRSASYTLNNTGVLASTDFEILLGSFAGPMGAVCILLLIVSAVILVFRRDISAGAFIGTMLGTVFMAYLCPVAGNGADSVKYVLATNMILFAAVYIISDLRIAPKKNYYAFFYGFFISITSYIVMLTTGKENVIVIMSVLFTPVALGFKNLQKRIDTEAELEAQAAMENASAEAEETAETEQDTEISAEETVVEEGISEAGETEDNSNSADENESAETENSVVTAEKEEQETVSSDKENQENPEGVESDE